MNRALLLLLMTYGVSASADELKTSSLPAPMIHVATALDHLTVLEFGEPVRMAAAGSPAFQIERHDNKVFIKPLKAGASTDLFVWTASRRFTYELEPAGEVKNMNFAIDSLSASKPERNTSAELAEVVDATLIRAFLGAEPIISEKFSRAREGVTVRIEHVFQSKNGLYIHYSIVNRTLQPYRVTLPKATEIVASHPAVSLISLRRTQIDGQEFHSLGDTQERALTVARVENQKDDLQAGEETHGVAAIRDQLSSPVVIQLTFGPEHAHQVQGTVVF